MPDCFVIMPLTTPKAAIDTYSGDIAHFAHVLEHLFAPAVNAAGYTLIEPAMRGGDLIQAEIVKNLETADLVLCDMSLLNANVFFELGIRTALDKPVAMVKDDKTTSVPFDNSIINHHAYDSSLAPWTLATEIDALKQHLTDTATRSQDRNSLWRYFGVRQRAEPAEIENPIESKLDLLIREVDRLRGLGASVQAPVISNDQAKTVFTKLADIALETGATIARFEIEAGTLRVDVSPSVDYEQASRMAREVKKAGLQLHLNGAKP